MRSSLKLDQHHNAAIRAEMGDRLRIILLSRELPKLPARVQHLLDRLSRWRDRSGKFAADSALPRGSSENEGFRTQAAINEDVDCSDRVVLKAPHEVRGAPPPHCLSEAQVLKNTFSRNDFPSPA